MKDNFKYIVTRVLGIALVFFLVNFVYKITFHWFDLDEHAYVLNHLNELPKETDAVYFGESSNFYQPLNESKSYRISKVVDSLLPELNIGTVDHSGIHAGNYLALIKQISNENIKIIFVTFNIRSFGANWRYSKSENNLNKMNLMMAKYPSVVNRFLVSLKEYEIKSDEERNNELFAAWKRETFEIPNFHYNNVIEWDSAMAWNEFGKQNANLNKENIPLACHYIKNFAQEIDTLTNERIKDFDEIVNVANSKGIKVYFVLLDENMDEGERLVGKNLTYLVDRNVKMLVERYERKGAVVINNFNLVPDSCFVDRDWPTEHYSRFGKQIIAKNIKHYVDSLTNKN